MTRRRHLIAAFGICLVVGSLAAAQEIFVGGGRGFATRWGKFEDFDGSFLYCRAYYNGGWTTDYPGADNNFSIRLAELTRIPVKFDINRQPHHVVVHLDDPVLYRCPMLFIENVE